MNFKQFYQAYRRILIQHSIRKFILILVIILWLLGGVLSVAATYSPLYSIKKVHFSNEKYYYKFEKYGDTFLEEAYGPQFHNISLKPDGNSIFTISAYEITPRDRNVDKFPTIIWCHGMVVNTETQLHYALEMAAAGFKVIAIGLAGHGDEGGLWDLGIFDLEVFYSAVDYAYNLPDVDRDRIGISGHSNGGLAAARAGIFDKTPLGTGGKIKSVASLWTVSDMNSTIESLIGENPMYDPRYTWLIPMFAGVDRDYFVPSDIARRAVVPYVNSTNINNWFVVSGSKDQMSPPIVQSEAISGAIDNSISPQTLLNLVQNSSTYNSEGYGQWNNTADPNISFNNGTARKLEIWKGITHEGEAFHPGIIQSIISWFRFSFGLDPKQYKTRMENGVNVMDIWVARFAGWIIILLAWFMSQIVLSVYLANIFFPERAFKYKKIMSEEQLKNIPEMLYGGFLPPGLEEYMYEVKEDSPRKLFSRFLNTWKRKGFFFVGLALSITGAVAFFFLFQPRPFLPIWIFNAYIWQFLIASIIIWIYALLTYRSYKHSRFYGPFVDLSRVGASRKGLLNGFLYTSLMIFPPVIIYNIFAYISLFPLMWPRPFSLQIWGYLFLAMFIIWALYLPFETMTKTQLFPIKRKFSTKIGYWDEVLINSLVVVLIWGIGYLIGMLFMGNKLVNLLFNGHFGGTIFIVINGLMFLLNGGLAFVTGLIYQRTRNLFACSFYPVFIWAILLFSKIIGMYSTF
ncbi:MAG: alpha/beta hydrolase family protein [Promethearchaeota archaeon]